MEVTITPSRIEGTITAPASKSAMQRACAAALLKGGETVLYNAGVSNDDKAALVIIQQLGATINYNGNELLIRSEGLQPVSGEINCGESGLSVRLFTSLASLSDKEITITGSGSLLKRPLQFFNDILPQLQVVCESNHGFLPLLVQGPLQPKNIEVDGSLSSQFLTGLLFAYAAASAQDVTITVHNLNSKPYIDLTLQVMEAFGIHTPVNNNYTSFYFPLRSVKPSNGTIKYTVEGDWSGGAFLLVAGAIAGDIVVKGLDVDSAQADKAVLQALMQTGADMSIEAGQIHIRKMTLKPFHFNATDCPDLFPPLVALAACCTGTSVIEGVHRLTHKESNRGQTLQQEFAKMGIDIIFQDDLMMVKGGGVIRGARVHSHHDHRIAMACAVAALRAEGDVVIDEAEAVNKSYPQFWEHLQTLGAPLSLINT